MRSSVLRAEVDRNPREPRLFCSMLLVATAIVASGAAACSSNSPGSAGTGGGGAGGGGTVCDGGSSDYRTGCKYLLTFYPRWFSYAQLKPPLMPNMLFGPATVDPEFQKVVAVNVDTLYAAAAVDVSSEPVIVTLPPTKDVFSVLHVDDFGQAFTGIPGGQPGLYGLTGPSFQGALPAGITKVAMPYDRSLVIIRADRYSVTGEDTQEAAAQFRHDLHLAPLSAYQKDPSAGAALIVDVSFFATSFKVNADALIESDPMAFLTETQAAVRSGTTRPLTAAEEALASAFDAAGSSSEVIAGAKAGHAALLDNYEKHTVGGSRWISFDDIADWDESFQGTLNRASITEFLQYGNRREAAMYYHCFVDPAGEPLDGTGATYALRFGAGEQPPVGRFWSLTAYTPDTIELVPNSAGKYAVASYTPGLVTAGDGSVTITMATARPADVPEANWLPVPKGPFNVMLRAYAPEGSALDGSYVPPPVMKVQP